MRTRRNRIIAFVVAGVLVLVVAFGGMVLYLGRFQRPDTGASMPAVGVSTNMPVSQPAPSINGSFAGGGEPGDGPGDGGFQTQKITATPHATAVPTTGQPTTRTGSGG